MARQEAGPHERRPNSRATLSQAKTKGNYQARVHSDQIVLVMARWEAGPHERRSNLRAILSQAKTKGNYQARVHSGQIALVVVRREGGPVAWWPKMLK
jgi:hypothetical protein